MFFPSERERENKGERGEGDREGEVEGEGEREMGLERCFSLKKKRGGGIIL